MRLKVRRRGLVLKSPREMELMRVAASTTAEIVQELVEMVAPGVSTWDLDQAAEAACRDRGVTPAFKGLYGFPGCLCVAVNEVVVHGIPSKDVVLKAGDIIGLDFGVVYKNWYGDHARTVSVGPTDAESERLITTTQASLDQAVQACVVGERLNVVGRTVSDVAAAEGLGVVRDFVGHGIGRKLHEEPQVPNFFDKKVRTPLRPGMVICIEPMLTLGTADVSTLDDGWTAVTDDRRRSAHFEHTVAISANGPEVLSTPGHGVSVAR